MSKKIMILSLAIFLLCQAGLDGSEAPKLASRVPDDAVAAFFVRNVPALAHGKAWMSSLSQAFDGELVIALLDISERKEVPPFVVMGKVNPEKLRWFLDARVKPILRRNLGKVEFESSEGMTAIVVNGSPTAFFAVKGNLLSFSLSKKVVSDSLSRSLPRYESLLTNDLFEKILDRTPADSRSVLFVSIERILETFGHKIPEQERKIWKAIGMLDIAAVGGYDELVDGAQVSSLILITSGKPRGSLALDAQSPAPLRAAKYVPADYSLYARLHFSSFSDVWAEVKGVLQQVPQEDAWEGVAGFLEGFREATGLDFEKDLLDSLGGEVAVAAAVPEKLRIPDAVALLEVKNRKKIEAAIAKFLPGATQAADEYKDTAICTVNVGPLKVAYAFLDNYLVAGTDASALKSLIDAQKGGASLMDNPAFRAATEALGDGAHLFYLDAGSALPLCLSGIREAAARSDIRSSTQPPRWEVVGKLLMSPLLTDVVFALAVYGDDESVTYRGYSTIRATYNWMMSSSIVAGMMLPALSRARESARRVSCMSNLKQLALAEHTYAADHDAKFSEKLSDLYPNYVSTLDVFTCPAARGPKITRKEDIDSLSSYVLRKGLTEASPADEVLIYEELGNHRGDGANAAFVDGHVERLSAYQLQKTIDADQEKQEKASM